MSTRRIISLMDPKFSSQELVRFDPEPESSLDLYMYVCISTKLGALTGNADKYNMRVGSKIRDYKIKDRTLTINGAVMKNPLYSGQASRSTNSMKRELTRVFPIGERCMLNVYRSDENTAPFYSYVYIDALDITKESAGLICFTVKFLLPDVYFTQYQSVTNFTVVKDEDFNEIVATATWSNPSDHASETTIQYAGLDISTADEVSIESYLQSASGVDYLNTHITVDITPTVFSNDGFIFMSETGEFYPVDSEGYPIDQSLWANSTATSNLRIYPGSNKMVIRAKFTGELPESLPVVMVTSQALKDDPFSNICD